MPVSRAMRYCAWHDSAVLTCSLKGSDPFPDQVAVLGRCHVCKCWAEVPFFAAQPSQYWYKVWQLIAVGSGAVCADAVWETARAANAATMAALVTLHDAFNIGLFLIKRGLRRGSPAPVMT